MDDASSRKSTLPNVYIQRPDRAPSVVTRRSFVRRATSGFAGFGLLGGVPRVALAQLVWKASEWKLAEFRKLMNEPARVKQVFDVVQISNGAALNSIKNALNGLQFGFGIAADQIKIVAGWHGAANMLNYDEYIWDKYRIGDWLNVIDPATGKPAVKNLFYKSKGGLKKEFASNDPDDPDSIYQDTSMQALQARSVHFLSCHTALEEQVRVLIRPLKLPESPEEIARDMLAHTVPSPRRGCHGRRHRGAAGRRALRLHHRLNLDSKPNLYTLYQYEVANASDLDLKTLAQQTLPRIQDHVERARNYKMAVSSLSHLLLSGGMLW